MHSYSLEWWTSKADALAVVGLILGGLVAAIGIAGWVFSWKAGKLKDEALDTFKLESKQAISEADAKAAEANKIAAQANERAAGLQKEAAQARLELEQIKEKQKFREISPEQKIRFIDALKNAPKGSVTVEVLQQDSEIVRYANQIRDLVVSAGYNSGIMVGIGFGSSADPVGILVFIKDKDSPPAFVRPLREALIGVGIDHGGFVDPSLSMDEVKIIVGRKR